MSEYNRRDTDPISLTHESIIVYGEIVIEIASRSGEHGKLYFVRFSKAPYNQSDQPSGFLRFQDIDDVRKLCDGAEKWVETDRNKFIRQSGNGRRKP